MVFLWVLLVAVSLASPSGAGDAADFGFGADVAKHFVMPPAPDHVHEAAAEDAKPVMVMLMNKGSPVCNVLKKAIKNASKVKALLDSFTVAYAEDNIEKWTTDKYVPQVIFFNNAERLDVQSGHKSGKYLYADESKLEAAMKKALSLIQEKQDAHAAQQESTASGKVGCSGSADCEDIDDKDMCDFTDGCSWSFGAAGAGPCQGGSQCKGIDEQDMCEFTDGCSWTGEVQDVDEGSAGPDHQFRKEFSDKMLVNKPPSEARMFASKANKPLMVLLTQSWCGPCKALIMQINEGKLFKALMDDFVIAHSTDDRIHDWQEAGANYVPQTYFFQASGDQISISGEQSAFKYFFETEYAVTQAMRAAYKQAKKGSAEL